MKVSFLLLAFNQEKFIKEALQSILEQEFQPIEIIVSDDCSTDNTWGIINKILDSYNGEHVVIRNRNEKNLGIAQHFNKVFFEFCHGEIILTADGDDISFPIRTKQTLKLFEENPGIMGLSFGKILIDAEGKLLPNQDLDESGIKKLTITDYINSGFINFCGSSRAFRRDVMDSFGPLQYSTGNDIFVFNRCLMGGGYIYCPEKMVLYRVHDNNTEHPKAYTRQNIRLSEKQFLSDLNFALRKQLISESIFKNIKTKKITPIIHKFRLIYISFYHPFFYELVLLRRKIKKYLRKKNQT